MITATDKRTPSPGFSTGTPTQAESADTVMVQPTTTYMEGSKIVGPGTPPYSASRHHAEELKTHGFATYTEVRALPVDPPLDPVVEPVTEPEVEQPDDQSRAPDQAQQTASSVPSRPGAAPETPPPGPVPPAAKSEPPARAPTRRRGRQN